MKNRDYPLKGANTEELFMYFGFINEYIEDLWTPYNGGLRMSHENEDNRYHVVMQVLKDLRFRAHTRIEGTSYTLENMRMSLREIWKDGYYANEVWEQCEYMVASYGIFQIKTKEQK